MQHEQAKSSTFVLLTINSLVCDLYSPRRQRSTLYCFSDFDLHPKLKFQELSGFFAILPVFLSTRQPGSTTCRAIYPCVSASRQIKRGEWGLVNLSRNGTQHSKLQLPLPLLKKTTEPPKIIPPILAVKIFR